LLQEKPQLLSSDFRLFSQGFFLLFFDFLGKHGIGISLPITLSLKRPQPTWVCRASSSTLMSSPLIFFFPLPGNDGRAPPPISLPCRLCSLCFFFLIQHPLALTRHLRHWPLFSAACFFFLNLTWGAWWVPPLTVFPPPDRLVIFTFSRTASGYNTFSFPSPPPFLFFFL